MSLHLHFALYVLHLTWKLNTVEGKESLSCLLGPPWWPQIASVTCWENPDAAVREATPRHKQVPFGWVPPQHCSSSIQTSSLLRRVCAPVPPPVYGTNTIPTSPERPPSFLHKLLFKFLSPALPPALPFFALSKSPPLLTPPFQIISNRCASNQSRIFLIVESV